MGIEKKEYHFETFNIVLKIPSSNQIERWNFFDENGEKIECEIVWVQAEYGGKMQKMLKKTEKEIVYFPNTQRNETIVREFYYVKGYGLWKKNVIEKNGDISTIEELEYIDVDRN